MLDPEGLRLRAALFHSIRTFFRGQGLVEVDTPIRQPLLLPESVIAPLRSGAWFLQPSPEQCMKRLLARGIGNIFQICPCFRAGERGRRHLEEFTMLEWYRVDAGYLELMEDCQDLLRFVRESLMAEARYRPRLAGSCFGTMALEQEWERLSVAQAFALYGSLTLDEALAAGRFDEIICVDIEPRLGRGRPTFLYDYPAACASLARIKEGDPGVAERFELYIDGMELANGFSELTDVTEQRARFAREIDLIEQGGAPGPPMPENFLADLAHIDRAAGLAFGLDRLLMLLLGADSISEVVSISPADWDQIRHE